MIKKIFFFTLISLLLTFSSCDDDHEPEAVKQTFQVRGEKAQIPSLYFSNDDFDDISGIAKAEFKAELIYDSDENANVLLSFRLGYFGYFGGRYLRDVYLKEVPLRKGEKFTIAETISFVGEIYDYVWVIANVKTEADASLQMCPVRIISSEVKIIK